MLVSLVLLVSILNVMYAVDRDERKKEMKRQHDREEALRK